MLKLKTFEADRLQPRTAPTGDSLQEKVETFLGTIEDKDIVDLKFSSFGQGQFGLVERHFAYLIYKES